MVGLEQLRDGNSNGISNSLSGDNVRIPTPQEVFGFVEAYMPRIIRDCHLNPDKISEGTENSERMKKAADVAYRLYRFLKRKEGENATVYSAR
jgi:hypothetical protein